MPSYPFCIFCSNHHGDIQCPFYFTVVQRRNRLDQLKRCHKCLSTMHPTNQCQKLVTCSVCNCTNHYGPLCYKYMIYDRVIQSYEEKIVLLKKQGMCLKCLRIHPYVKCGSGRKCRTCGSEEHHRYVCPIGDSTLPTSPTVEPSSLMSTVSSQNASNSTSTEPLEEVLTADDSVNASTQTSPMHDSSNVSTQTSPVLVSPSPFENDANVTTSFETSSPTTKSKSVSTQSSMPSSKAKDDDASFVMWMPSDAPVPSECHWNEPYLSSAFDDDFDYEMIASPQSTSQPTVTERALSSTSNCETLNSGPSSCSTNSSNNSSNKTHLEMLFSGCSVDEDFACLESRSDDVSPQRHSDEVECWLQNVRERSPEITPSPETEKSEATSVDDSEHYDEYSEAQKLYKQMKTEMAMEKNYSHYYPYHYYYYYCYYSAMMARQAAIYDVFGKRGFD